MMTAMATSSSSYAPVVGDEALKTTLHFEIGDECVTKSFRSTVMLREVRGFVNAIPGVPRPFLLQAKERTHAFGIGDMNLMLEELSLVPEATIIVKKPDFDDEDMIEEVQYTFDQREDDDDYEDEVVQDFGKSSLKTGGGFLCLPALNCFGWGAAAVPSVPNLAPSSDLPLQALPPSTTTTTITTSTPATTTPTETTTTPATTTATATTTTSSSSPETTPTATTTQTATPAATTTTSEDDFHEIDVGE
eukprot:TRINITY_DN1386_c3_g1_i1.p1 TRINITY_DN1386_c3_g1~~TRINITY_DN1386_c3_g1_i1.p1  ORF type:complete len:248 (+),score=88.22 TRINITY_DN1386_c3_g1_i1:217-960(+)